MAIVPAWKHFLATPPTLRYFDTLDAVVRNIDTMALIERQVLALYENLPPIPFWLTTDVLSGGYSGPAIHVRRPQPSFTDNERDDFERTDSGLYVPKPGRPAGKTKVSRDEFVSALRLFVARWRRPPSQSELQRTLLQQTGQQVTIYTIQNYAGGNGYTQGWFDGWPSVLEYCMRLLEEG